MEDSPVPTEAFRGPTVVDSPDSMADSRGTAALRFIAATADLEDMLQIRSRQSSRPAPLYRQSRPLY